jgi:hypothetical protein
MRGDSYQLQGQQGGQVINAASGAVTGEFRWLTFVEGSVLTSLTNATLRDASKLVGGSIPAGIGIGGVTTAIAVASGTVIAYDA